MVPILSILCGPYHPGPPVTFPIRAHHEDRNFRPCASHGLDSLHFLILEQGQRKVYREVLIAGDLSMDDVSSAASELGAYQVSQT